MGSLLMAASNLGFVTEHQKQYLWKQMSARGYRLREPPELDFLRETPTVIESLLRVHREGLGYSVPELADLLHVGLPDLRSLYAVNDNQCVPSRPKLTILK
jgi:Zn-dependent peptidase ImmA (M78 family)